MSFELTLLAAFKTPGPKAFPEAVGRALISAGAIYDTSSGVVRLDSGESFEIGFATKGDAAGLIFETLSEAQATLVATLAEETKAYVGWESSRYAPPSLAEAALHAPFGSFSLPVVFPTIDGLAGQIFSVSQWDDEDLEVELHGDDEEAERRAAFETALAARREELAREAAAKAANPPPSLFKRLSDALFGKAI